MSNIELYEALRDRIGDEAARMIAAAVPQASEVATRSFVRESLERLEARLLRRFEEYQRHNDRRFEEYQRHNDQRLDEYQRHNDQRFDALEQRFDRAFRWALAIVAPVWAGGIAVIVRVLFFG